MKVVDLKAIYNTNYEVPKYVISPSSFLSYVT